MPVFKTRKLIALISMLSYLTFLFYLLFFSAYRNGVKGIIDYNLIPFQSITRYIINFDSVGLHLITDNLFGNIFAFVPLGFLLPILVPKLRTVKLIIIISCLFSLCMELTQFIFRLGALDIDDILLNAMGGFIGFCIFKFFPKINH